MSENHVAAATESGTNESPSVTVVGVETVDVVVEGLVRDGASTWIATVKAPTLGIDWPLVYLHGATEDDAYNSAVEIVMDAHAKHMKLAHQGQVIREKIGEQVRVAWIRWAKAQPIEVQHAHPHWFTEWADLSEPDKEADRAIGEHLIVWLDDNGHRIESAATTLRTASAMRTLEAQAKLAQSQDKSQAETPPAVQ